LTMANHSLASFSRSMRLRAAQWSRPQPRRGLSTPPPPSSQPGRPPASSSPKDPRSRLRQFNDRLPRFLRVVTTPLLGAPMTHVTSFLILHEITAIVPIFGLVGAFHYGNRMPDLSSSSGEGNAFDEGAARFGRWLRKKGWVEESDVSAVKEHDTTALEHRSGQQQAGVRLVLEFATAYAITKALLPFRIVASVWATPWFARSILSPTTRMAKRLFSRK
jgi:hypothetical protein